MRLSCAYFSVGVFLLALVGAAQVSAAQHPSLILTADGVQDIKSAGSAAQSSVQYPLFDAALTEARDRVELSIREGVIVPAPKDPGGGYTHERHKENYKIIHDAGLLYQITGEQSYVDHAKAMLFAYADMYGELPLHLSLIHI